MSNDKRFVAIDNDEIYYITDTKGLKTLDDYIKEFNKPEYEFDEEEANRVAQEEYWQMIYENSMGAKENVNLLNNFYKENEQLKKELKKYTDAFDCSQCRFQNYDWFDDGDEFEVCEKGNNEAQMENHSCSEWELI